MLGETPSNKKLGPQLGYMPQELALSDKFTVRETVVYFGRIFGVKVEKIERKLDEILGHFEMLDKRDSFIVDCSGGQMRVVSFILTVVHEPQLLVFDEPTVGLDVMLRQKMWQFLKECSLTSNSAIIITTHYTEEAEQADTVSTYNIWLFLATLNNLQLIRLDIYEMERFRLKIHQPKL